MCCLDRENAIESRLNVLCSYSITSSYFNMEVLTTDKVLKFRTSPLERIFLVGHRRLRPPVAVSVALYTSSAYSVLIPSAGSHMPMLWSVIHVYG